MTNPNNGVGTNAGYNGRTTPNAFNDVLAAFESAGIVSGWTCSPKSGMTVQLGGNGTTRDVAIAEDNAGNRTTINNRLETPIEKTIDGAPATGNRIDAIVAYVNNPQSGLGSTDVDFPSQVGFIAVKGTASGSPVAPTAAQIKSAITADGGDGATAYYVTLASITVGQGVTTIGSGAITQGAKATINATIGANSVGSTELKTNAVTTAKIASSAVTDAKIGWTSLGNAIVSNNNSINVTSESETQLTGMSLTATKAGKYLAILCGNVQRLEGASGTTYPRISIAKNGIKASTAAVSVYPNSQQLCYCTQASLTLAVGDVVSAIAWNGAANFYEGQHLSLTRIG